MNLGFSTINSLDEISALSTPATIIWRLTYGSHWRAPDHVFGEATAVLISVAKLDHNYNYKTEFQIWKVNKEFELQNILMSWPPLDLTTIGTNMTNARYHIWTRLLLVWKLQTPSHQHDQHNHQNAKKIEKIVRIRESGVRPIIIRLIIEQIWSFWWQQIQKI